MRVHRGSAPVPPEAVGCAVAIGNFDGVHRGHRAVVEAARRLLPAAGRLAVLTFEPHPREVVSPATAPRRLSPLRRKIELLRAVGVDRLFLLRFDRALMALSAETFVTEVLVGRLGIRGLACGEGFRFGHRRQGDAALLEQAAGEHGFAFAAVPPVTVLGAPCSSTRVRDALDAGEIGTANELLGYPFEWRGMVRRGEQRGRTLGFPTANLEPDPARIALPATGVYAVSAGLEEPGGVAWHPAVANLGTRPTFAGDRLRLEAHLLDRRIDLYGRRLRVAFLERLRGEQRFPDITALRTQIEADCAAARRVHGLTVSSSPG